MTGVLSTTSGVTSTLRSEEAPLYNVPDQPAPNPLPTSLSVRSLVEHRSALDRRMVVVAGVVVAVVPYQPKPPQRGILDRLPEITLADTASPDRDRNYDVRVELRREDDGKYAVGERVEVAAQVSGGRVAIVLSKQD